MYMQATKTKMRLFCDTSVHDYVVAYVGEDYMGCSFSARPSPGSGPKLKLVTALTFSHTHCDNLFFMTL